MSGKPVVYHCKVGTVPAAIVIRGRALIRVGSRIKFRFENGNKGVWESGTIDRVNPDGYFFVNRV